MTRKQDKKPSIISMRHLDTKALRALASPPVAGPVAAPPLGAPPPAYAPATPAIVKGEREPRRWGSRIGVLALGVFIGLAIAQVPSASAPPSASPSALPEANLAPPAETRALEATTTTSVVVPVTPALPVSEKSAEKAPEARPAAKPEHHRRHARPLSS